MTKVTPPAIAMRTPSTIAACPLPVGWIGTKQSREHDSTQECRNVSRRNRNETECSHESRAEARELHDACSRSPRRHLLVETGDVVHQSGRTELLGGVGFAPRRRDVAGADRRRAGGRLRRRGRAVSVAVTRPVTPSSTTSGALPTRVVTAGMPTAAASINETGIPSLSEVSITTSLAA